VSTGCGDLEGPTGNHLTPDFRPAGAAFDPSGQTRRHRDRSDRFRARKVIDRRRQGWNRECHQPIDERRLCGVLGGD
jgi:hypothetical protein